MISMWSWPCQHADDGIQVNTLLNLLESKLSFVFLVSFCVLSMKLTFKNALVKVAQTNAALSVFLRIDTDPLSWNFCNFEYSPHKKENKKNYIKDNASCP